MKLRNIRKRGQISIGDAPMVVLIVIFVFILMATVAYIGDKLGGAVDVTARTNSTAAHNITLELQTELQDNTSIAGIVLTISLVGIVLSVLIGIFVMARGRRSI